MGCRIAYIIRPGTVEDGLVDPSGGEAALFCSVSGLMFGPIFDSVEDAEGFIEFCPRDPREHDGDNTLAAMHSAWMASQEERSNAACRSNT